MDPEGKKFGRGPRELTGAVDLINHYKLWAHHDFFCKRSLPLSISDTHYLHSVVGDTEIKKGEGMELDQLFQSTSYTRDRNAHIQPFDLDTLSKAFQLREAGPIDLPSAEKGIPTIAGKSKSESKDKERKHKKHKDRDKDKDKDKEHKKHKHRHKDRSKEKDKDKKKDKSGHHESGEHSKKHHDKKRKHDGGEDLTDIHKHKKSKKCPPVQVVWSQHREGNLFRAASSSISEIKSINQHIYVRERIQWPVGPVNLNILPNGTAAPTPPYLMVKIRLASSSSFETLVGLKPSIHLKPTRAYRASIIYWNALGFSSRHQLFPALMSADSVLIEKPFHFQAMDTKDFAEEGQERVRSILKEYGVPPFSPLKGLFVQGSFFSSFLMTEMLRAQNGPPGTSMQQAAMDTKDFAEEAQERVKAILKEYGVTPFSPLKGLFVQGSFFSSFLMTAISSYWVSPSFFLHMHGVVKPESPNPEKEGNFRKGVVKPESPGPEKEENFMKHIMKRLLKSSVQTCPGIPNPDDKKTSIEQIKKRFYKYVETVVSDYEKTRKWIELIGQILVVVVGLLAYLYIDHRETQKKPKLVPRGQQKVTGDPQKVQYFFKDVAGCDEAKQDIMELLNFLKDPEKYEEVGAKMPKGVLLIGPPGTGKTLLAKAMANESGLRFIAVSGSEFVELYGGLGAARVRNLFAEAKKSAPCIIFIDEIDAIGLARGDLMHKSTNNERENTLNQLLVELDGFENSSGVFVLASTNRAELLDKALLRPGRFDRVVTVDPPDIRGREEIFEIYLKRIKIENEPAYYSKKLAALTPGFTGADIANVCNEAALIAARYESLNVTMYHFEAALDRIIGGSERKSKVISKLERRTMAYHEAGHVVVGWFLEHAEALRKVSIVPRGTTPVGYSHYNQNENLIKTKEELFDVACMALAGRASEQILLGKISTRANDDLERVTRMAYDQVAKYGFSEKVGLLSFPEDRIMLPYGGKLRDMIDSQAKEWLDKVYHHSLRIIQEHKDEVSQIAELLLEREILYEEDLKKVMGDRPFK
ncbi:Peptidase M41 [Macleaya cordata]|uniref:Peptidase M41 n=1 Tax=Macleaya cordata TaxID=56857 RepID=A0A200R1G9_MACCD|nr:Peptidase M41 [Macleaya cordata]